MKLIYNGYTFETTSGADNIKPVDSYPANSDLIANYLYAKKTDVVIDGIKIKDASGIVSAVDFTEMKNDISNLETNAAYKNKSNTFTLDQYFESNLKFKDKQYSTLAKIASKLKGETLEANENLIVRLLDSTEQNVIAHCLAEIGEVWNMAGDVSSYLTVYNSNVESTEKESILIGYDKSQNKFYTRCPSPDTNSDTSEIATTEWVRDRIPELAPEPDLSDYVKSVNNIAPDTSGNVTLDIHDFVPSGTKMLFYQASAPTGWAIDTSVNDAGVRIVSSNGGTVGGSTAFSSIFKSGTITTSSTSVSISGTTGNRALSVSMLASHNHGIASNHNESELGGLTYGGTNEIFHTKNAGSNGTHNHTFSGSSSHSHNITLNLKYINVIVCSKN